MRFDFDRRGFDRCYEENYFMSFKDRYNDFKDRFSFFTRHKAIFYDRVYENTYARDGEPSDRFVFAQKRFGSVIEFIEYFREVADGRSNCLNKRHELKKAINMALRTGVHTIIIPSVNRLIRPETYSRCNEFAPLLMRDIRRLEALGTDSILFVPLIPPGTDEYGVVCELSSMAQLDRIEPVDWYKKDKPPFKMMK